MTLQETLLSAIVLFFVTAMLVAQAAFCGSLGEAERAAARLDEIARAAQAHLALNRASILAGLEDGGVLALDVEDLRDAGLLPNGVAGESVWHQDYAVRIWRRKDAGITGSSDDALGALVAALGVGTGEDDSDAGMALVDRRRSRAARSLEGGFWKPSGRALAAMGLEDESLLVGPGGLAVPSTAFGIEADELPAGSFGRLLGAFGEEGGVDSTQFLSRVGNGSPGRPNVSLSAMETDIDMGDNRIANAAALRFTPVAEGLLSFSGSIAENLEAFRAACKASAAGSTEAGEDGTTADLEGMVVADSASGLWRCSAGTPTALHDSRSSVLVKAVALVPFDTTIEAPGTCPEGSVRTVYAIPTSSAVKEVAVGDGSYTERENAALLYFGTAAQEIGREDGSAYYDFPAAIDIACPDGDCPLTDHNFDNLVIVACQYPKTAATTASAE